jgi:phosphoserine phosphatase
MHDYVIVLLNGHGAAPLTPGRIHDLYFGLVPQMCRSELRWLGPGEAVELPLRVEEPVVAEGIADAIAAELAGQPIDSALLPAANRRKRLLVADMESTIVAEECLDELAAEAEIGEKIAAITARAMRGEIDFEPALRERVALLKGMHVDSLSRLLARLTVLPGARTLVATMRAHGAYTALVSGGFSFFTEIIAARVGFDIDHGNQLGMKNGILDGTIAGPILGRQQKADHLARLAADGNLTPADAVAVGDGANDIAMVQLAGLGVAYRGKPLLAGVADAVLRHADLTALLYLQGYQRMDFVIPKG